MMARMPPAAAMAIMFASFSVRVGLRMLLGVLRIGRAGVPGDTKARLGRHGVPGNGVAGLKRVN